MYEFAVSEPGGRVLKKSTNLAPSEHFAQLFAERERAREAAGGRLTQDEEFRLTEELDDVWNQMTAVEQQDAERRFVAQHRGAPT